jgi:GTPase SAR1 family protein
VDAMFSKLKAALKGEKGEEAEGSGNLKIALIGPPKVGKTAFAKRFNNDVFVSGYNKTNKEEVYAKYLYVDKKKYDLDVHDTCGFQAMNVEGLQDPKAVIYCFSGADKKSLEELTEMIEHSQKVIGKKNCEDVIFVLLQCQTDLGRLGRGDLKDWIGVPLLLLFFIIYSGALIRLLPQ